jgi:hypothetical protein
VAAWASGKNVTPYRVTQVRELLQTLVDETDDPSHAPRWAQELRGELVAYLGNTEARVVSAIEGNRTILLEALADRFLEHAAEQLEQQPESGQPDETEAQRPAQPGRPQGRGRLGAP